MLTLRFEWDSAKAERNLRVHGVTFGQAADLMSGSEVDLCPDVNGKDEERWLSWGMAHGHSMMACWTERDDGETTRIISARRCTSSEWDKLRERAWRH